MKIMLKAARWQISYLGIASGQQRSAQLLKGLTIIY